MLGSVSGGVFLVNQVRVRVTVLDALQTTLGHRATRSRIHRDQTFRNDSRTLGKMLGSASGGVILENQARV